VSAQLQEVQEITPTPLQPYLPALVQLDQLVAPWRDLVRIEVVRKPEKQQPTLRVQLNERA
jgi:hypothetical protein